MNVRYRVELTTLLSGGKHAARKLKRAQILLAADAGVSDEAIATAVAVGESTVYRTKRRFVLGNLEAALSEEPRPGAERKLTGKEEALLVATACAKPPAGRRLGTGGGDQQRLFLARELAFGAGPRLFAERRLQIAEHEAALGPVHRRFADRHGGGDRLVADPGIGCQQNLRPLELARRVLAAAQQRRQFVALGLAQFDPIPYIHRCPPKGEDTTDESDAQPMSSRFASRLHAKAGAISRLHPRLYARARPPARRSRPATALPSDPALSPPDGADPRTRRTHSPPIRRRAQHQSAGRARRAATPTANGRATGQILCAEVLVESPALPEPLALVEAG